MSGIRTILGRTDSNLNVVTHLDHGIYEKEDGSQGVEYALAHSPFQVNSCCVHLLGHNI
jgi:hypothetical protein